VTLVAGCRRLAWLRLRLAAPAPGQQLADIVEELEEALDYCRSTGISFADPDRLLQQA